MVKVFTYYLHEREKIACMEHMAFYNVKLSHIATEKLFLHQDFLEYAGHVCFKSYS